MPEQVNVHDFIDKQLGKAVPYGVYDVGANTGWVSVGVDHDTTSFAVNSIRTWWNTVGKAAYPRAGLHSFECRLVWESTRSRRSWSCLGLSRGEGV